MADPLNQTTEPMPNALYNLRIGLNADGTAKPNTSDGWDGYPPGRVKGWHMLLSNSHPAFEEVWHFDPNRECVWERRESGCRHGWNPAQIAHQWEYVGRLELVP